jgi:hypothetical protein
LRGSGVLPWNSVVSEVSEQTEVKSGSIQTDAKGVNYRLRKHDFENHKRHKYHKGKVCRKSLLFDLQIGYSLESSLGFFTAVTADLLPITLKEF